MRLRQNKLFVIIVIMLFGGLFFAIFYGRAFKNSKNEIVSESDIDWSEIFPYTKTIDISQIEAKPQTVNKTSKYAESMLKFGKIGSNWTKYIKGYDSIAKIGFVISSRLSDPSVGNTYIRLKNGSWVQSYPQRISRSQTDLVISKYASLQNYVENEGRDFLYFCVPQKDCKYDDQYPNGVVSYVNQHIDTYIEAMEDFGINYVDLRNNLHSQGLDHYEMYYLTDHHWKVSAGLWAASEITKEISNRFDYDLLDPSSIGTYHDVTYEMAEFGSAGVGVTHFVASPEDLVIPYPDFDTKFRLEVPSKDVDAIGRFEEIFVDEDKIYELIEAGGGSAYGKVLYGNQPYERITNYNNPNGPKIIVIKDSFANVVAPYLAEACSELVLLDVRPTNGDFNGSIINCIDEFDPDIVLIVQGNPVDITLNK